MAGNTSYQTTDYTAFAIEKQLQKKWVFQTVQACPLLACIHDRKLNWNTGYTVEGLAALVPVVFSDIPGFNSGTAGIADTDEIPTGWPSYDQTEGFSQARFEFTHFRRAMTIKESERVIAGGNGGHRGNLIEGKTDQLMSKFTVIKGGMVVGNQNGSRQQLMGAEYAIATANTVGGIDQSLAANVNWRGTVTSVGGAIDLGDIYNIVDALSIPSDENGKIGGPDLVTASYTGGTGTNVFGAIRGLIDDNERFVNKDFYVKYGIKNFMLLDMKVVMENRQADQTAFFFDTSTWLYGGYDRPQAGRVIRIPGSDAEERIYTEWCFLGVKEVRRNGRLTGITG